LATKAVKSIPNEQWQRVDPTAAVSPERIEFGMDALTELWDGNDFSNASGKALSDLLNPTGSARYLRQIKDSWDNISYQWNKWVVNYDQEKQRSLLENLGLKHKNSLTTLVGIISFGVAGFMLFYFWQLIPKTKKASELEKTYNNFTDKFAKFGLSRSPSDTPERFRSKAVELFPDMKEQINAIIEQYQTLRYGRINDNNQSDVETFKRHVKRIKLTSLK